MIIALQQIRLKPEVMVLFELGLPKDDIVWMTDRLRSVLLVDNEGCVVPLHATFREFLCGPERCINPLYYINKSKGHAQLASACIGALTFENITAYLTANNDAPQRQYLEYTKFYWPLHLKEAEFDDGLKQRLMCLIDVQMVINTRKGVGSESHNILAVAAIVENWLKVSSRSVMVLLHTVFHDVYLCSIGF